MNKYLKSALIAICLAIPFILIASVFGIADDNAVDGLHILGAIAIFLLGMPLTIIPMKFNLGLSSHGFIVVSDILFIAQWIIWSQITILVRKKSKD